MHIAASRFANALHADAGSCISRLKATGLFDATSGKIDWSNAVFKLTFTADKLTEVAHVKTGKVGTLPPGTHITKDYVFNNFWSEADATARLKPFPAIKLTSFFDKDVAVFGHVVGFNTKKGQEALAAKVKEVKAVWDLDLSKLDSSASSSSKGDISAELARVKSEQRKEKLEGIQKKAMEQMQHRSNKRVVNFTDKAPGQKAPGSAEDKKD